mmetsp:Transcript_21156/g.60457  ORF Transcript_21156/g.60457 Transcript_21156/m.60457 type:complete len:950 (+) Transcript_21156:1-2850(+)
MSFVRESKFRHVFGEQWKTKYEDIQLATKATESAGVRANGKFIAVPWMGGGGPLAILPAQRLGKVPRDLPKITGHTGPVLDFEFSPFDDNMLASASEDHTIKAWSIPDEGLRENMRDSVATFDGHGKKVLFCTFNPAAAGVIASASYDMTCKVWNLQAQQEAFSLHVPDQMLSLRWNYLGSLLGGTCKDKKAYVMDPRSGDMATTFAAHESTKASKLIWLGGPDSADDCHRIVTTGFSKQTDRQVGLWDIRMLQPSSSGACKPLLMLTLDQGAAALYPHYDAGTGMLYIVGKGDATVRYFEVARDAQELHFLSQFSSPSTQKGFDFVPKRAVDVSRHEVMRGLKLESSCLQPISFRVPRLSEAFQDDLFPDCPAITPAMQAEDWTAGIEAQGPLLQSMRPAGGETAGASAALLATASTSKAMPMTRCGSGGSSGTFKVGNRVDVMLRGVPQPGTVQYVGDVDHQVGVWIGVALAEEEGEHDGSAAGRRYFECPPRHGIFVRASQLTALREASPDHSAATEIAALKADLARVRKECAEERNKAAAFKSDSEEKRSQNAKVSAALEAAQKRAECLQEQLTNSEAQRVDLEERLSKAAAREEALRKELEEARRPLAKNSAIVSEVGPTNGNAVAAACAELAQADAGRGAQPLPRPPRGPAQNKVLTYKEQRELERQALEDRLSAPADFQGRGSELTEAEREVIERKGTEAAGSGEYNTFAPQRGYFACRKCGRPLYSCEAKFKSGCGWPAFDKCYSNSIVPKPEDDGTGRIEITCAGCGGHLGHIFVETASHDKKRSDQRHCANSLALQYIKDDPPAGTSAETVLDLAPRRSSRSDATDRNAMELTPKLVEQTRAPCGACPTRLPGSGVVGSAAGATAGAEYQVDLGGFDRLVRALERSADRFAPAVAAEAAAVGSGSREAGLGNGTDDSINLAPFQNLVKRIEHAAEHLIA